MKKNFVPLIGMAGGIAMIVWSITSGGSIAAFVDAPSLILVLGGSFFALFVSYPLSALKQLPSVAKKIFVTPKDNREQLIGSMIELSRKARGQGILSIEADIDKLDDKMLITGLQMAVDGVEPEMIREILEIEIENIVKRHTLGQVIFAKWGELCPAFGMLGTVIGLINMLGTMDDPSTIGSSMAIALITTLYGSFLSNLVFVPISANLRVMTEEEVQVREMIIEGVLSVQAGQNPRIIEQQLSSYLPGAKQGRLEKASRSEAAAA